MDPKTGFVIMRDDDLADTRRRSLDLLYQPLLHPTGYALINILWRLSEIRSNSLIQRPFKDLLTYLNVDLRVLKESLKRIEGAGLLKTFYKHDSDHQFYIFYLIQPRSAREFFRDDLLSVGLLEMIGNRRFAKLSQALIPKPILIKNAHDVTRNFLEVFTVDHKHLTNLPELIKRIRSGIHAKMSSSLRSDHQLIDESPDFDFKLLLNIIKNNSFADPKSVYRHRHLILTEHVLYGLDEHAMASYIGDASSVVNNKVDFNKFRLLIAKAFQGNATKPVKAKYQHSSQKVHGKGKPTPSFQRNEQLLINAAEFYPPVQFLQRLKKQLNSNAIVTHQEESTLKQALEYGAFPDNRGVINILVYYLIVDRKMPTLKSAYMQYMITAWNQVNVNTPAEALSEIKSHQRKRTQRWLKYKNHRSRNKFSYQKQPRIKQKLPKWARSDYQVKLHPTSQKLQRKIKRQLKDLSRQPKHRKGGRK